MTIALEEFQFVLLRRAANPPRCSDEQSDQIQRDHRAFYRAMREAGQVVTNGPMTGQPDETLRGIVILAVESAERARELVSNDPAIRAGRLEAEVMTWWCPPGTMIRAGRPVTIDD